ncbi:hypothetical protein [Leadbettera azotonutricia]|uniref:Uncharacterized protein n=1 Tax=Leadbettera azotonutricia (strain ATCC BAA-888 / DSM 13862 / ZAS-9) TaxID=545695 RepID=F5YG06_LEAAZ|nr:hypothetical protein [Leadbettera azotonutricia]AEF80062.1 hypothetical protein TREAZ_1301 [Leadbettera azotonutricia ZAS-9]
MSDDARVIWKKGGDPMPGKAQHVVDAARGELLLKTLQLPEGVENTLRYNADKDAQSVNDYVSRILVERLI